VRKHDELRVQVAYRDFDEPPEFTRTARDNKLESKLTFVTLIGMEDHIRPEVMPPLDTHAMQSSCSAYFISKFETTHLILMVQPGCCASDTCRMFR
jgi:hypothetical protein